MADGRHVGEFRFQILSHESMSGDLFCLGNSEKCIILLFMKVAKGDLEVNICSHQARVLCT
jgi:hypothetical protein